MNKYKIFYFLPLFLLACGVTSGLPVLLPTSTSPANFPTVTPAIAQIYIGPVIGLVNVRNTPEANGAESWIVDTLQPGEWVEEIDCLTVGNSVWVKHKGGWSVARNSAGVYIKGVCEK